MFTYTIYPEANEQLFKKAYQDFEKALNLKAGAELVDVDGSQIMHYKYQDTDLFVISDSDYDSIIVRSELEISKAIVALTNKSGIDEK